MPEKIEQILLVDDDEDYRESTVMFLKASGFTVLEATNGNEALAIIDSDNTKREISKVVTDFNMPGMNGVELAIQIKQKRGDIYVVLMSARESDDPALLAALQSAPDTAKPNTFIQKTSGSGPLLATELTRT